MLFNGYAMERVRNSFMHNGLEVNKNDLPNHQLVCCIFL